MDNENGMVRLESKDYEKVYKMADAIVSTKTCINKEGTDIKTQETVAAQAVMYCIDQAREDGVPHLIFTENEVICLASVVSKE